MSKSNTRYLVILKRAMDHLAAHMDPKMSVLGVQAFLHVCMSGGRCPKREVAAGLDKSRATVYLSIERLHKTYDQNGKQLPGLGLLESIDSSEGGGKQDVFLTTKGQEVAQSLVEIIFTGCARLSESTATSPK